MTTNEPPDDDGPLGSYFPLGGDYWEYEPCLYGEFILESRYLMPDGLYHNADFGQGPDSWGL